MLLALGGLFPTALRSPMLHGLADLETNQVAPVAFAAFLLLSAALTCCFLVLLYGAARVEGKRQPPPPGGRPMDLPDRLPLSNWTVSLLYVGAVLLFARFLFSLEEIMLEAHIHTEGLAMEFWLRTAVGIALGALFMIIVFVVDLLLSDPRGRPGVEVFALPIAYLFRQAHWLAPSLQGISDMRPLHALHLQKLIAVIDWISLKAVRFLGPGYGSFDEEGRPTEIFPGHRFAAALAGLCYFVYWQNGRGVFRQLALDEAFRPPQARDAVLLQVILLMLLACWGLSAFCFYFDRFRIPVLIPMAIVLLATSRLGPSDHAFHTLPRAATERLGTPTELLEAKGDSVIVVAAAGGGIQSAAWTSQVLCGLRRELGPTFEDKVLAISGVSGGSVGTMFYLRCVESPAGDLQGALAARNSSLEAVAWGLAYPDLRRAILPVDAFLWPGADRGWALERALRKNAQFTPADRPLASTKAQPKWPIVLLNATEVRTGDPLVFTNSDFPEPSPSTDPNHGLHGFHLMYSGRDALLESAVRMSAAFPYVSAAARPDTPPNAEHLVDGGYFDNSGLFTLTKWLKTALPEVPSAGTSAPPFTRKRILLLSINAFPDNQWNGPADKPESWFYQLLAPVYGILHVRSEGQVVRDLSDTSNLLQLLILRGYEAQALTVRYVPSPPGEQKTGEINCPQDPPLTWHLTEVEKRCIDQEWLALKPDLIGEIDRFFAIPSALAGAAPTQAVTKPIKKGLYLQKLM